MLVEVRIIRATPQVWRNKEKIPRYNSREDTLSFRYFKQPNSLRSCHRNELYEFLFHLLFIASGRVDSTTNYRQTNFQLWNYVREEVARWMYEILKHEKKRERKKKTSKKRLQRLPRVANSRRNSRGIKLVEKLSDGRWMALKSFKDGWGLRSRFGVPNTEALSPVFRPI